MFDVGLEGLSATFEPSRRITSKVQRPIPDARIFPAGDRNDQPFNEVRYSMPICAATMQHYHMARVLLLINKPHETTARRSTITYRLKLYRDIEKQIVHYCCVIWYVVSARFLLLLSMILV